MEERAHEIRLAPFPDDGSTSDKSAEDPSFDDIDLDAARELAEYHRLLAAELPPSSQVRGLVLRCAGHWSRLGAIPRNGLVGTERAGRQG